ncbi:PulJ/GspJ family protein [Stratiformator vulcanicus]|uniref:Uncharacterized protein n=1 Tax=Stratiformator vulcanicus TaxID=2527980 RepID=A0A517R0V9_9PLAN|nr:prepilin-type N-terminal cleavage/methylation domain-containing protein [Stratiformator vulcanicus]QDT37537.1 hypothetical protein Pan189_19170 [Stratiformator vulcanicus]
MLRSANKYQSPQKAGHSARRGFTLVEALVSVALVMLMMVMFSQVFGIVGTTIQTQKGIAENDQRARLLVNLLQGDLQRRTYRDVVPFWPGQNTSSFSDMELRRGYFSISENESNNPLDDVLALTIETTGDDVIFGKTAELADMASGGDALDQPEFDDGVSTVNGVGVSTAAEVVYFLRGKNLYRSVLLIRDPYVDGASGTQGQPKQDGGGGNYFSDVDSSSAFSYSTDPLAYPAGPNQPDTANGYSGVFWRDFDYAAFYDTSTNVTKFHSVDFSLSNDIGGGGGGVVSLSTSPPIDVPTSLGLPHLRYGSSLAVLSGAPREYLDNATNSGPFLGRFLKRETADDTFRYPGETTSATTNPYRRNDLTDSDNDGVIDLYDDFVGRRNVELLLTDVLEFDVKVFDDGLTLPAFVDLGNGGGGFYGTPFNPTADSTYGNTTNLDSGSGSTGDFQDDSRRRYDTWHPALNENTSTGLGDPINGIGVPAYAPYNGGDRYSQPNFGLGDGNEEALKAIQIRVVFKDPSSEQIKQVTITQSLVD